MKLDANEELRLETHLRLLLNSLQLAYFHAMGSDEITKVNEFSDIAAMLNETANDVAATIYALQKNRKRRAS